MCSLILSPPKVIMKIVLAKTCFHRGFEVLKNISFVKEKGGASKIKSGTKNLQNLPSMIYKSVILELFILVLALYSYYGYKRKYVLVLNHLFQKVQEHGG